MEQAIPEKRVVVQLHKNFPAFCETQKFIVIKKKNPRDWTLPWLNNWQNIPQVAHLSQFKHSRHKISKWSKLWIYDEVYLGNAGNFLFHDTLISASYLKVRGTRWRSWLRHYATSWKDAGSTPDGVIGIFHWHYPSGRTMALGLIQSLTEMSTRTISWGLRRPVRRADDLTTFMCRLSRNLGASTSWNPQGLFRPVTGIASAFYLKVCYSLHKIINLPAFYICVIVECYGSQDHEKNLVWSVRTKMRGEWLVAVKKNRRMW
jgi:hypothetical protein